MAKIKLPSNKEVEQTVLGTMMANEDAVPVVLGSLTEDDFYEGNLPNKLIFRAMRSLQDKRMAVDFKTVYDELINMKSLDTVGGLDYLQAVADSSMGFTNLEYYIQILKDQTTLRNFIKTMDEIIHEYQTKEIVDIPDFVAQGSDQISKVAEKRRISDFRSSAEIANIVAENIEKMKASGDSNVTGVPTGYTRLNELTHGFQPGQMVIVAARPSVGKTALGINIAMNAAERENKPVGIFSIEMPAEQLIQRLMANRSGVELGKIQTGKLTSTERKTVDVAMKDLGRLPLFIDDTPGISLLDLVGKAKKLKKAHDNLSMIVIDYIGLITTGTKRYDSRQLEVSEISRTLKELARELKIPIVVISQLSRNVETRADKRPMLSDLRESGSLEQDADVVLLLYRGDYYKDIGQSSGGKAPTPIGEALAHPSEPAPEQSKQEKIAEDRSDVEIAVAKNRNGKVGRFILFFWKSVGRFEEPTPEYEKKLMAALRKGGAAFED